MVLVTTLRNTQKIVRQAHWNYMNAILNKSLQHENNKPFRKYIKASRSDYIEVAAIMNLLLSPSITDDDDFRFNVEGGFAVAEEVNA